MAWDLSWRTVPSQTKTWCSGACVVYTLRTWIFCLERSWHRFCNVVQPSDRLCMELESTGSFSLCRIWLHPSAMSCTRADRHWWQGKLTINPLKAFPNYIKRKHAVSLLGSIEWLELHSRCSWGNACRSPSFFGKNGLQSSWAFHSVYSDI